MFDWLKFFKWKRRNRKALLKHSLDMFLRAVRGDSNQLSRGTAKRGLKGGWWLVYGAGRSGTSYMARLISTCSRLWVSDWSLENLLKLVPDHDYIKFDRERALRDISDNILDNAYLGGGDQLDLVFKEAYLEFQEYQMLVKMWGPPTRIIFCFRQPAAHIHSALEHFTGPYEASLNELQQDYVRMFNHYKMIGGDTFEYKPSLTLEDYLLFLKPLVVDKTMCEKFVYKGQDKNEHTTPAMWVAYHDFRKSLEIAVGPPAEINLIRI